MRPESKKYLYDILKACEAILQFVENKTLADYDSDLFFRSAVERQFMIVGEALNQAVRLDEEIEGQIEDAREIINLRNVIVLQVTVLLLNAAGLLQSGKSRCLKRLCTCENVIRGNGTCALAHSYRQVGVQF